MVLHVMTMVYAVVKKLISSMTNAMHVLLDSFTFLYAKSVSLDVLLMNYVFRNISSSQILYNIK